MPLRIVRGWRAAQPQDFSHLLPVTDGGDGFGKVIIASRRSGSSEYLWIDAVRRALAGTDGEEIIHDNHAHSCARANGRAAEMRSEDNVSQLAKAGFELWLALEDIQSCAGNTFGLKRPHQRRFVNDRAAARVDQKHGRLHQRELFLAEQMMRVGIVGDVQ